ncbi:MAG: sensor domain-containing diguanylate cyclase [Magnetovibrionaceae bacterium]
MDDHNGLNDDASYGMGFDPDDEAEQQAVMLAGFPGAALLANYDGSVLATNPKGAGLQAILEHGAAPEIRVLMEQATNEGSVAVGTVHLMGVKGEVTLEVTCVPQGLETLVLARDTTMERNLRTALVDSRQRYKDLVEVSSDFAWEVGGDGMFMFVSPKGALGFRPEELVGHRPQEFVIDPSEYDPLPFLADAPMNDVEMWMLCADGAKACVMTSSVPMIDENGDWHGVRGVCRDVTLEREHEAALGRARQREQLLNYIVSTIRDEVEPENILNTAAGATARGLTAAVCRLYKLSDDGEIVPAAVHGAVKGTDTPPDLLERLAQSDTPLVVDDGYWQILASATRYHGKVNGAIMLWKGQDKGEWDLDNQILIGDVANQLGIANEQIANHERIVRMSRTDAMTGLLNRRAFFEQELPRRIERLKFEEKQAALLYVDMDNFKKVNDVHGHQAGDDAIIALRDLLIDFARPGDQIARLGGDEFAVWLDGIPEEVVPKRAENLIQRSDILKQYSGHPDFPLGISVGVAIYDSAVDEDIEELLLRADAAMYTIKKGSKGGYVMAPPPGTPVEMPTDKH